MEKKEFEEGIKKVVTQFVAPDGKMIMKSLAVDAISALKTVINALAEAVIKQAKEEAEKAQKELESLNSLKV